MDGARAGDKVNIVMAKGPAEGSREVIASAVAGSNDTTCVERGQWVGGLTCEGRERKRLRRR